jgi:hypothetical protein
VRVLSAPSEQFCTCSRSATGEADPGFEYLCVIIKANSVIEGKGIRDLRGREKREIRV